MESLDKRKKNEELFQLKNVIADIRKEFGDDIEIIDGEAPDFSIVLPDKIIVGMEVTRCCPSEKKSGNGRIKDVVWKDKVEDTFISNDYFLSVTKDQKLWLMIDGTPEIYRRHHRVEECCKEIEEHLRQILSSPEGKDKPSLLIKRVRVVKSSSGNMVNFNHIARRNAIKASELLKSLLEKESKLGNYSSELRDNCWLCIYLPWQENRHPYPVYFDDECTQEMFEKELASSKYKRIYVASEYKPDLARIK
jgi:hypothetical protein